MNENSRKSDYASDSISGNSAAHFISKDDSLASLLINHGIDVRDFIFISFLFDQGPMSVSRISRIVGIEAEETLKGLKKLVAANLVTYDGGSTDEDSQESIAKLTTQGESVARRVTSQLE